MLIIRTAMSRVMLLCFALMPVWQISSALAADQGTDPAAQSWQKEVLARVGAIQGDTQVQRAGEAKFKKIRAKSPLYILDYVATGKNSKLWWQGTFNAYSPSDKWKPGPDVTHGSLATDSVFGFKQFMRAGASYRFIGFVPKGTVRFIKTLPNTNPPSSFVIGTHTAWIEALPSDRAADFIVQSKNEAITTVTVLWGKVRVRNVSPEIKESRILTSCQEVDVERDQEPGEIKWVSTDTMKELVKRTTIPRTLPEDVPSCERLKTEVLLDVTAVFLPPPGVALYPAIVPVPVPVPGDKADCCPPGQIYDPRTGACKCPCPEGELPPIRALGGDPTANHIGPIVQCGDCRQGATFNPQTCSCECPCPQGFLLPGIGCVPQCPVGYSQAWDSSASPPYRCLYCVQYPPGTVVDPVPPPPRQCSPDTGRVPRAPDVPEAPEDTRPTQPERPSTGERPERPILPEAPEISQNTRPRAGSRIPTLIMSVPASEQCGPCEECIDGNCLPKVCRTGFYLDRVSCACLPVTNNISRSCAADADCSLCQRCREGQCVSVIICGPEQRLNPDTCQCEPVDGRLCPGVQCGPNQRLNPDTCKCERHDASVLPHPARPETPEVQFGVTPPACQNNSDCPEGRVCRQGKCVGLPQVEKPQCRRSLDCPIGEVCRRGKCVSEDEPPLSESPTGGTQVGPFPGGVGAGDRIRVGPGTPSQQVAPVQRVPRQTAPVQRVPRVKPR